MDYSSFSRNDFFIETVTRECVMSARDREPRSFFPSYLFFFFLFFFLIWDGIERECEREITERMKNRRGRGGRGNGTIGFIGIIGVLWRR